MQSVAVFVKNLTSGGAEKQSVLLAKSLADIYDVHYIIFNGAKVHLKYMKMLKSDKRIHVCTLYGGHFFRFNALVKYLKTNKIRVIFSYLTAANFYACIAGRLSGSDVFTGLRNAELPFLKLVADRFMTNHWAKSAIVNCYSGQNNFVKKGFDANKTVVIPNCFDNISPYKKKARNDVLHIITVGRFVVQKDYETAIRTIAVLRKISIVKFIFNIVGYGGLETQIREWVRTYRVEDCVSIFINPDNIPELLETSDIYLSTSLFEGTSNSIMEAMNADLPVVATDVGDNFKLVENNVNGFLCAVGDYKSLADKLCLLLDDEGQRVAFGENSKKILLDGYSVKVFRERYMNILSSVLTSDVTE